MHGPRNFRIVSILACTCADAIHAHAPRNVLHPERFGHRQRRVENNIPNFVDKVHGTVESCMWLRSFRRNLLPPSLWLNHEDGEVGGFLQNDGTLPIYQRQIPDDTNSSYNHKFHAVKYFDKKYG